MTTSSAYVKILTLFSKLGTLAVYNVGDNTAPCKIPDIMIDIVVNLKLTLNLRSSVLRWNRLRQLVWCSRWAVILLWVVVMIFATTCRWAYPRLSSRRIRYPSLNNLSELKILIGQALLISSSLYLSLSLSPFLKNWLSLKAWGQTSIEFHLKYRNLASYWNAWKWKINSYIKPYIFGVLSRN